VAGEAMTAEFARGVMCGMFLIIFAIAAGVIIAGRD